MTEKKREFVVVLGMHRSGTSALTGMLHHLGVHLGQRLMSGSEGQNQKGFFENGEIYHLNEGLLEVLGVKWHDLGFPGGEEWWRDPRFEPYRREGLRILRDEFGEHPVNGIKDPRLCRLLPFWLELFGELGVSVSFVFALRHPKEVTASLARRDRMSTAKSVWLWLDHLLLAERASRGYPRVVVTYRQLLDDWRGMAERMSQALKINWPRPVEVAASEIDGFLTGDLRHHHFSDNDGEALDSLHEWVAQTYRVFLEESSKPGGDSLAEGLDAIQKSYRKAMELWVPDQNGEPDSENGTNHPAYGLTYYIRALYDRDRHIRNLESMIADRDTHVRQINDMLADRDRHIRNLEAANSSGSEFQGDVSQLKNRLGALDRECRRLREDLRAQQEAHELREAELSRELTGYRREAEEILNAEGLALPALTDRMREEVGKRKILNQRLAEEERRNNRLRQDLEVREEAFDDLCKAREKEREKAAEEQRRLDLEVTELQKLLAEREEGYKAGGQRIAGLERELGQKEKLIGEIRADLSIALERVEKSQSLLERQREQFQHLQEAHAAIQKKHQLAEAEKDEKQRELHRLSRQLGELDATLEATRARLRNWEAVYQKLRGRPWYKLFAKLPEP